jgi:hypothetical protein
MFRFRFLGFYLMNLQLVNFQNANMPDPRAGIPANASVFIPNPTGGAVPLPEMDLSGRGKRVRSQFKNSFIPALP